MKISKVSFVSNDLLKCDKHRGIKTFMYATLLIMISLISCKKEGVITDNSRYDLREHNLVTPVRNQNGLKPDGTSDMGTTVGLCWAFGSLASMESNMLKQGITSNPHSPDASLSPWYLGNYIGFNLPCYEYNPATIPDLQPPSTFGFYFPSCGWGGGGSHWG